MEGEGRFFNAPPVFRAETPESVTALNHFTRMVTALRLSAARTRTLARRRSDRETAVAEAVGYLTTPQSDSERTMTAQFFTILRETQPDTARIALTTVRAAATGLAGIGERRIRGGLGIAPKGRVFPR